MYLPKVVLLDDFVFFSGLVLVVDRNLLPPCSKLKIASSVKQDENMIRLTHNVDCDHLTICDPKTGFLVINPNFHMKKRL